MKLRLPSLTIGAAAVFLLFGVLRAEEPAKCSSTARECEHDIRQMLSGRRYLGIQIVDVPHGGILIKAINNDGPAARVDLEAGDRIAAANGRSMMYSTVRDFKGVLAEVKDTGGLLFMIILRRGNYRKVEVRLQPYPKTQIDKIVATHLAQSHTGAVAPGSQ